MLQFPIKYRNTKRVKPSRAAPSPPPPPAGPRVLSVAFIDDNTLLWTFDRTVVHADGVDGLMADGQIGGYTADFSGATITVGYPDPVTPGGDWEVSPGILSIDFAPPGDLSPQTGTIGA